MVRKAMNILLRVTSENNERFSSPVIFKTFSNAAKPLGFTEQGIGKPYRSKKSSMKNSSGNNKKRSHTQLDSRKQVIAFQDRVITINIKEAQHPLK